MMSIVETFAAADFLSFLGRMIVLFGFCAGLILLNAWVAKRSKDRDMARRAKLDQMMRANATNDAKRQARAIEEVTRTCLSKEDMITLFCLTSGPQSISTSRADLSSPSDEEPKGSSVTLNIGG